jgi:uncharacterized iron-regulated membrane protein
MSRREQWRHRPHATWLRKAAFQVHLWAGVVLSLYVIMLSVTGSILVYRAELTRALDDGTPFPRGVSAVLWVADLHDNLLLDRDYRAVNGIGAILLTLLVLTGAVVWWRGIRAWRRALTVKWSARWPRVNWDLHSASGFWLYLLILNWSITGIYLAFPSAFVAGLEYFWPPDAVTGLGWTDVALDWLTRLHFGRWRNPFFKALWFALGLVPALLAVTGLAMWWNRVLREYARARLVIRPLPAHSAAGSTFAA